MVLSDRSGISIYTTGTALAGQAPCHLTVKNDGTIVVVDSTAKTLATLGASHTPYGPGQLVAGQYLTQVWRLPPPALARDARVWLGCGLPLQMHAAEQGAV